MDKKKLLHDMAYLILIIFILHNIAIKLYWYSAIWWFDMLMHFLGGFWVGLLAIYLFTFKEKSILTLLKILSVVLLVGVGWEIFELYFQNYIAQNSFDLVDTSSDIFFDLAGGTVALLYYFRKTMPIPENKVQ